jgi:hypothetical protein
MHSSENNTLLHNDFFKMQIFVYHDKEIPYSNLATATHRFPFLSFKRPVIKIVKQLDLMLKMKC